jgi:hypothetical protein
MTNWSQDGAPSFNRPELVRFDSLRDSKDLGAITDIKAHLSGFIGAEAGSQSLFFSFQLLAPGAIQVQTVTGSKWTARFVSASLRSESGSIGLDDRGNARGVDIVNSIDADEALAPFPPGKYTVVVSCSQWQSTPFELVLRVNPTTRLHANLAGRGGLGQYTRLRVAVARLSGALTGLGQLRAPGSGLFSGRRDRPLVGGFLAGRGALTGKLSVREPLRSLSGAFLAGRGGLGASTVVSNNLGPRMWASRLVTPTEATDSASYASVALSEADYSLHAFYYLPPGSPSSQRRLAVTYRAPNGQVLWSRLTDIYCLTNDTRGWKVLALTGGDFLLFSQSQAAFGGLLAIRIGRDGVIAWKRQFGARINPVIIGGSDNGSEIEQISDVALQPSLNRVTFAVVIVSVTPGYITLDLDTGAAVSARALRGGTMQTGHIPIFDSGVTLNAPLIKADGRFILTGSKRGQPAYTWTVECDSDLTSVNTFYKYTDGTSLVFDGSAVLHTDGSVTIAGGSAISRGRRFTAGFPLLQLAPDMTIRRRVTSAAGNSNLTRGALIATDALGALHYGDANGIYSRDYEGDLTYRYTTFTGLPGRIDEVSSTKPGPWFNIASQWGILATSTASDQPALGTVVVGFEIDMAPTTVANELNYSITIGTSENVPQARQVTPAVVALDLDENDGGIVPIAFVSLIVVLNTSTPAWNPVFTDASSILAWELTSSAIRRGTSSEFPQLAIKPDPAIEPDPLAQFVVFHLPGTGIPDTNFFVDYSRFVHQPIPLGNVKYSTEQALYPDLGGFFERTSIRFDGIEDAIACAPSPAFRFGKENFTIEAKIFRLNSNPCVLFSNSQVGDPGAHSNSFYLALDANGILEIFSAGRGRLSLAFSGSPRRTVPYGAWSHVALTREDQVWRVHVNGQVDSAAWRYDLDLSAGALLIGRGTQIPTDGNWSSGNGIPAGANYFPFTGFMADIRITKEAARYHRNFQPRAAPIQYLPAGPPASSPAGTEPAETGAATPDLAFNRVLLFARMNGNDNVFRDSGPYDHSLIPFGNVTQIPGGKWGGSQGAFDSFGDWVEVPTNPVLALGTGDFTISMWAKRTGEGQEADFFQALLDSRTTEPESQFCLRINRSVTGRQLCLYVGGAIRILGQPMAINVRYHVAVVRRSGITSLYMNGVPAGNTWADATNYTSTSWTIGRARFAAGADQWYFQGHLNDVRIERGALYDGAFIPPTAPTGSPPSATARYWRLVDLRPYQGSSGVFSLSEIALHRGRDRLPGTTTTSLPAPSSGLLVSTQDLSATLNCDWGRAPMEQIGSWIQIDAGAPVTADGLRLATAGQSAQGVSGFTLQYSSDGANWATLGHVASIPLSDSVLGPRLGFVPLPGPPTDIVDADFDRVVLLLRGNIPNALATDSGPRRLTVDNVNVSASAIESAQGGQSMLFSAASGSYLTLGATGGDTGRRSVYFSFGAGALTVEMDIFPLTVPANYFSLFNTNAIGDSASYANGFQWVLTSAMKLDLYINGAFRGVSLGSVSLRQWSRLRLSRDSTGIWRYNINGVVDSTTFANTVDLSSRAFTIGRDGADTGAPYFYNGYMDEVKVTRGLARGNTIRITNLAWTPSARGRLIGGLVTGRAMHSILFARGRLSGTLATVAVDGSQSAASITSLPDASLPLTGFERVAMDQAGATVSAGGFVTGQTYRIAGVGSTDFRPIGAASNTIGLIFKATGPGTGNGTAVVIRTVDAAIRDIAGLAAAASVVEFDTTGTPNTIYVGRAPVGTDRTAAGWTVERTTFTAQGIKVGETLTATGAWTARTSLAYA